MQYRKTAAFILMLGLFQIALSQPQIRLDPEQLDLHAVWYPGEMMGHWEMDHEELWVINDGDATLRVTGFEADVEWLYASPDEFELEPEGRRGIRFDISDYWGFDEYDVTFMISSNDPDNEEIELPVHVILETFPLDVWPPFPFEADLYQGQVEQFEIILSNIGDEPIRFRIECEIIAEPDQDEPPPWLEIEPEEGVIEPDEQVTITITVNMNNCAPGDYSAVIIILTDNPVADVIVYNILIHVTAAPDIDVVWSEDYGYPDVVDWNLGFQDLFWGGPYDMVVEVLNSGSEDLAIEGISCENEFFTAEPNELFLEPDESAEVVFIFDADEPGEYNETMIFSCNDPDEEMYEVALHATIYMPPIIRVEPEEGFEEELFTGDMFVNELIIGNDGDAILRFYIEHRIIFEPNQDDPPPWLSYYPSEGGIEHDGGPEVIFVTLDATGAIGGDYEAELHILNNDPANSEVIVPVAMRIGAPPWNLVYWPEEWGFPDVLDFNMAQDDIFTGVRYELPIEFYNGGIDDLDIAEIYCENEYFHAEPSELIVEPRERREVSIIFQADEPGDYETVICIVSNDPDEGEFIFVVHAEARDLELSHFTDFTETERSHLLHITEVIFEGDPVPTGWEVGVFTEDDVLAGGAVWIADEELNMLVYGDDPETDEVEGFEDGEEFNFWLWDYQSRRKHLAEAEFIEGPDVWRDEGRSEIRLNSDLAFEQHIEFGRGWNLISLNIVPCYLYWDPNEDRGPDVWLMAEEFIVDDEQQLIIIKDERGDFFIPYYHYCCIDLWNLEESYLIKVRDDIDVHWYGAPIHPQTEISLDEGWNMIAYYPDYDLSADEESDFYVLSPIIDRVLIAKDGQGHFMAPRWEYSNMPPWTPCQGYHVNVDEDLQLVYPVEDDQGAVAVTGSKVAGHWTAPLSTGENMSLLINSITGMNVEDGDQIAAFDASDNSVGVGTVRNGRCGLAVWGDNEYSNNIEEGLQENETFSLQLWDADKRTELNLESVSAKYGKELVYNRDGFVVLDVITEATVPDEFGIIFTYPNPFNSMTNIRFGLPYPSYVSLQIFNTSGQQITTLFEGYMQAGVHSTNLIANDLPSGMYFARLEASGKVAIQKIMLIR